jgi:hypothetical protein
MMGEESDSKKLDKEFRKLAKEKFLNPSRCTQLNQTRAYIFELNKIIKHFEQKFNYIPPSAQLLFNEYNNRQEKMLFDDYMKEYSKE